MPPGGTPGSSTTNAAVDAYDQFTMRPRMQVSSKTHSDWLSTWNAKGVVLNAVYDPCATMLDEQSMSIDELIHAASAKLESAILVTIRRTQAYARIRNTAYG